MKSGDGEGSEVGEEGEVEEERRRWRVGEKSGKDKEEEEEKVREGER